MEQKVHDLEKKYKEDLTTELKNLEDKLTKEF